MTLRECTGQTNSPRQMMFALFSRKWSPDSKCVAHIQICPRFNFSQCYTSPVSDGTHQLGTWTISMTVSEDTVNGLKLVRTSSMILLSNLLRVWLAVLSNMGKKGFDHRLFDEPNHFTTFVRFTRAALFLELCTVREHRTCRTVRSNSSSGQL